MKRRTRKTEQARAILRRLGILPPADRAPLYETMVKRGFAWDTKQLRWEAKYR